MGPIFKQEGYFHWAFGVLEPDCYGILDVGTGKSHLFIPRLPAEYQVWMGHIPTTDETKERWVRLLRFSVKKYDDVELYFFL